MNRTLKIRLPDDPALVDTLRENAVAGNLIAGVAWQENESNRFRLQKLAYQRIREGTRLSANLTCACIGKVAATVKAAFALRGRKPKFREYLSVRYSRGKSYWVRLGDGVCSLSTIHGRHKYTFTVPAYYARYSSWTVMGAELVRDFKGRLWLHVVVSKEAAAGEAVSDSPVHNTGIDLGVNNLAVTSDNTFYKGVSRVLDRMQRLREHLQAKGTKSAKRHLKKIRRRQRLFMRDVNHLVTKQIVGVLAAGSTIALEDLTGIREHRRGRKLNRLLNRWAFLQFRQFLAYKAEERGVKVVLVDPRDTSKTCSACGRIGQRTRGYFTCACGHSLNSDLNGARNILARLNPTGTERQGVVNRPTVAPC